MNIQHNKTSGFWICLIAIMILASNSLAAIFEIPDEEEQLPTVDEYLRFGNKPGIGSGCLTNLYDGITDSILAQGWVRICKNQKYADQVCFVATPLTLGSCEKRQEKVLEFTIEPANELCRATLNYVFHCEWDETADKTDLTNKKIKEPYKYCKKLKIGDSDYEGKLLPQIKNNEVVRIGKDDDVYYIETEDKTGYCFQFNCDNELQAEYCLKNPSSSKSWTKINPMKLLDKEGNETSDYRLYITNFVQNSERLFIRLYKENDFEDAIDYKINVRKVRPLFLVHGINSEPKAPLGENETKYKAVAFQDVYDNASIWQDFEPVIPFPFPWDSENGVYLDYVSGGKEHLDTFVNRCCANWALKPVVIAHSMGGILTVQQMIVSTSFRNSLDGVIFLGTPFCGSTLGSIAYAHFDNAAIKQLNKLVKTSQDNYLHLSRGTSIVRERMKNIPAALKLLVENERAFFVCSESDLIHLAQNIGSVSGAWMSGSGDGIVNDCSSCLPNTLSWNKGIYPAKINHEQMHTFELKNVKKHTDYLEIYNRLKKIIQ